MLSHNYFFEQTKLLVQFEFEQVQVFFELVQAVFYRLVQHVNQVSNADITVHIMVKNFILIMLKHLK